MLFGLLSLLMGHWIVYVAKICVKSSVMSRNFFPCTVDDNSRTERILLSNTEYSNVTVFKEHVNNRLHDYCPEVV